MQPESPNSRGDVKVRQPHALGRLSIELRRLQPWIAVTSEIAVTLIVGDDQGHIRRFLTIGIVLGLHDATIPTKIAVRFMVIAPP